MRRLAALVRRPLGGRRLVAAVAEALGGPCAVRILGGSGWGARLGALGFVVTEAQADLGAALLIEQLRSEDHALDLDALPEGARVVSVERLTGGDGVRQEEVSASFLSAGLRDLAQRQVGSAVVTSGRIGPSLRPR